ncbi:hypothetical protein MASR2M8_19300 [Opitutaceae bacterium]
MNPLADEAAILAIQRPHRNLWTYYVLFSLMILPAAPVLLVMLWFRYQTLRYRFTDEGLSMSWGILFRREVIIQYARIQDIHLRSNVVERWLGLGQVLIQTASGSAAPEMTIEGLKEFEAVRDFLYGRMRGVKQASSLPSATLVATEPSDAELAATLREIAVELRGIRAALTPPPPPLGSVTARPDHA